MADLVTLAEAKAHLNKSGASTVDDVELQMYITAATEQVEAACGPTTQTIVTETILTDHNTLLLTTRPVLSVQSVSAGGVPIAMWVPDVASGVITLQSAIPLANGLPTPAVVTYTAGRTSVPASLKLAALIIIGHLWKTQRGGNAGQRGGTPEELIMLAGFAVPNRAAELMTPFYTLEGFA